jgi:hypothetical protein
MGNLFTEAMGNILTTLIGNVLTTVMGKVLDIYRYQRLRYPSPRCEFSGLEI